MNNVSGIVSWFWPVVRHSLIFWCVSVCDRACLCVCVSLSVSRFATGVAQRTGTVSYDCARGMASKHSSLYTGELRCMHPRLMDKILHQFHLWILSFVTFQTTPSVTLSFNIEALGVCCSAGSNDHNLAPPGARAQH